ncbi:restriction system protein [Sulfitobacter brevis]|uniref:Restriction system protein n=1 Tax=Sulfitobacter brevis TaxID=74348 RepID=A0A1I2HBR4_9RHOB|nr:restriction endonuclease [Sulfitobacter brevis]SFF27614.1 restriction system protein [Sulfitobacter brevis]
METIFTLAIIATVGTLLILAVRFPAWLINGMYRKSAINKFRDAVEAHKDTLAKKRMRLVSRDDYGNLKGEAWNAEIQYFFENVIRPSLSDRELEAIWEIADEVAQDEIENVVLPLSLAKAGELSFSPDMSPIDFEYFVAGIFQSSGWDAEVSKASGDQGADVVASRDGCKVVVQCKLYSKPVGNKAVQEVIAARQYYDSDLAYVVTNSTFTRSASQLAAASSVRLLHYSDIEDELAVAIS